jgi:hypothetical protein
MKRFHPRQQWEERSKGKGFILCHLSGWVEELCQVTCCLELNNLLALEKLSGAIFHQVQNYN